MRCLEFRKRLILPKTKGVQGQRSHGMRQPSRRGRNADKGLSDGLEHTGGEPRGFHGAVDETAAEREPLGRLLDREVHRIHRWGRAFDGD